MPDALASIAPRAGDLRQRITLQVASESVDAGGFGDTTPAWQNVSVLCAKIETQGGREFFRAQQMYPTLSHLVTIRYRAGLTAKHRFLLGARVLNILSIIDIDIRHVVLQIACAEVAA